MNKTKWNKQSAYLAVVLAMALSGCASTPPTKIEADTYFSSKTNTAGVFGDVTVLAGSLMAEGGQFCSAQGKEFELVTQNVTHPVPAARIGGASITFKCVDQARNPVMRPDRGVSTVTDK